MTLTNVTSRIGAFLSTRARMRGLDQSEIVSLNVGSKDEASLTSEDLGCLLAFVEARLPARPAGAVRDLLDSDGENRAVRCFLQLYGGTTALTTDRMRDHLRCSGFDGCWPLFAEEDQHLTAGGAQFWLRHLFSLENDHSKP